MKSLTLVTALACLGAKVTYGLEISSTSAIGRALLSQSTRVLANNNQNNDNSDHSFLKSYSIKFQGCHHVQQWNDNNDNENDDVRIKTKRLARYRLCPADSCNSDKSAGCTAHFGDYVVDLNTFVTAYLSVLEADQETMCANAKEDCNSNCNGDNNCMQACYSNYGLSVCWDVANGNSNALNVYNYGSCAKYDMNNNNGDGTEYYLGPYCAVQGGEIHLGMFTDDTCTTFAQYGSQLFYQTAGYELPYSDSSMVSSRCLTCAASSNNNNNNYGYSQQCGYVYSLSGKCETRMEIDYPNESSCSYIEGIKIVRADGVIRTSTTKKSKAAAVGIGVFMTVAVLLGAYVYYLRTKLARAQINLAAASQPLT